MSKVYFTKISDFNNQDAVKQAIAALLNESKITESAEENDKVGVKITFGEEKNTGFVKPEYIAEVISKLKTQGTKPFVFETNTIYHGKRSNSIDHLNLAFDHGFTRAVLGAPIIIADGLIGAQSIGKTTKGKHISSAKIAPTALECDFILGIAHMTGHMLTGFGAAIKNIGMGLASRAGKLEQHSNVAPVTKTEKCTGCGACVKVCPADAIALVKGKCYIHKQKCIGCGECLIRCKLEALDLAWDEGEQAVQEKMSEYASAILKDKKCAFINFANHITAECDCLAGDDPKIVEDIGILASTDPVALDKATCDLVLQAAGGKDPFLAAHPKADWKVHLEYAQKLGLGSLEHELVSL